MSTKKKRKPMRLWLVRDIDPWYTSLGGCLWVVESASVPWLRRSRDGVWEPDEPGATTFTGLEYGRDLAPGECVELRRVP